MTSPSLEETSGAVRLRELHGPQSWAAFAALVTTLVVGDIASADIQATTLTCEVLEFIDTVSGDLYNGQKPD